jgi:hypothetical protein
VNVARFTFPKVNVREVDKHKVGIVNEVEH